MHNHIIDLIITIARRIQLGEKLNEIKIDTIQGYNKSQISAAYSWIQLRYPNSNDLKKPLKTQRVLHFAERLLITPEAYGFLIELYNIGVIDFLNMEKIIEKVMFHAPERITLEKVKELVSNQLFEENIKHTASVMLTGNESIN